MKIATYEFYTGTYFGDIIPASSFDKFESRAEDELHLITRGGLKGESSYPEEVKKSVCALAEILYQIDAESKKAGTTDDGKGKIIKSVSSGSESISYEVQKSDYAVAASNGRVKNQLCYDAVKTYLSGTGLLYWGL